MGKINKEDLNLKDNYGAWKSYSQSKLANILFANELSRRLEGTNTTVNSLHPGVIATEIGRNRRKLESVISSILFYPFQKTLKSGCQTTVFAAIDPDLENVSGKYFQ